jgi:hypothetical protein
LRPGPFLRGLERTALHRGGLHGFSHATLHRRVIAPLRRYRRQRALHLADEAEDLEVLEGRLAHAGRRLRLPRGRGVPAGAEAPSRNGMREPQERKSRRVRRLRGHPRGHALDWTAVLSSDIFTRGHPFPPCLASLTIHCLSSGMPSSAGAAHHPSHASRHARRLASTQPHMQDIRSGSACRRYE